MLPDIISDVQNHDADLVGITYEVRTHETTGYACLIVKPVRQLPAPLYDAIIAQGLAPDDRIGMVPDFYPYGVTDATPFRGLRHGSVLFAKLQEDALALGARALVCETDTASMQAFLKSRHALLLTHTPYLHAYLAPLQS